MNKKYICLLTVLISVVVALVVLYSFVVFCKLIPIDNFGVFGDSFGILTALFSGLAFVGLIVTIIMQGDELKLQRKELSLTRKTLDAQRGEMQKQNETLAKQQFENTFFKMLEFLEVCVKDVYYFTEDAGQGYLGEGKMTKGKDAIVLLYNKFFKACGYLKRKDVAFAVAVFKEACRQKEGILKEYQKFYEENEGNLGQYYRVLYNIFELVNRTKFTKKEKLVYTNLVCARLSKYELLLIFYNCLSPLGEEKMAPLIRDYNILKRLDKSELPKEVKEIFETFLESKN